MQKVDLEKIEIRELPWDESRVIYVTDYIKSMGDSKKTFNFFPNALSPHSHKVSLDELITNHPDEFEKRLTKLMMDVPLIIVVIDREAKKTIGYGHLRFLVCSPGTTDLAGHPVLGGAPDLNSGVDLAMGVIPEYQGLGLGSGMMKVLIFKFLEMHKERVENLRNIWPDCNGEKNQPLKDLKGFGIYDDPTIYLTVSKDNEPAINLYKKFDFQVTEERENEYQMKRTFT